MELNEIGSVRNPDDGFSRDLIAATLGQFRNRIGWVNRFQTGDVTVIVPFYYSITGDPRYIQDVFVDDPRLPRVNTDVQPIPSCVMSLESFNIKTDQINNPNVPIKRLILNKSKNEYETFYTKVKPMSMEYSFNLDAMFDSERDILEFIDQTINLFTLYRFYSFEHKHTKIEAALFIPTDFSPQISREFSISDKREIKISMPFKVITKRPIFDINTDTWILNSKRMKALVDYIDEFYTNKDSKGNIISSVIGEKLSEIWVPTKPYFNDEIIDRKPKWTPDDPVIPE